MFVITLTTIPPRFGGLPQVLAGLLRQDLPPDRIILYVPQRYRRFPEYDGRPPELPPGVELRRPETDFGPASKVLHAVREFHGQDVDILFCDDDRHYRRDWTRPFLDARKNHPDAAIAPISWTADELFESEQRDRPQPQAQRASRARDFRYQVARVFWNLGKKMGRRVEGPSHAHIKTPGYRDIFQGYGGVMVKPHFFDDDVFDIPDVLWTVDDIWLSGMLAKAGTPIWAPARIRGPRLLAADAAHPLAKAVIEGADRKTADWQCFQYMRETYGIWP